MLFCPSTQGWLLAFVEVCPGCTTSHSLGNVLSSGFIISSLDRRWASKQILCIHPGSLGPSHLMEPVGPALVGFSFSPTFPLPWSGVSVSLLPVLQRVFDSGKVLALSGGALLLAGDKLQKYHFDGPSLSPRLPILVNGNSCLPTAQFRIFKLFLIPLLIPSP